MVEANQVVAACLPQIGRLQGEVEMYRRLWTSADNLTKTLGAAPRIAPRQASRRLPSVTPRFTG